MTTEFSQLHLPMLTHRLSKAGIDLVLKNETARAEFLRVAALPANPRFIAMLGFLDAILEHQEEENSLCSGIVEGSRNAAVERDYLITEQAEEICWQIDKVLADTQPESTSDERLAQLYLEGIGRNTIANLFHISASKLNRILKRMIVEKTRY